MKKNERKEILDFLRSGKEWGQSPCADPFTVSWSREETKVKRCPARVEEGDGIEPMSENCTSGTCVIHSLRRKIEDDEGVVECDEEARLALIDYWQRHEMD